MEQTRRWILVGGAGAAAAVIVGGGGLWWAKTRVPKAAFAPWHRAGQGFGDARLNALSYAILAPSPHNMQPWRIHLGEGLDFSLHCDTTQLLPETDPFGRQMTIGFGCFLELLRQAAAEGGYRTEVTPFPEGEPAPTLDDRPIARIRLVEDAAVVRDPLFGTVLDRHTSRAPFDTDRIPDAAALAAMRAAVGEGARAHVTTDAAQVQALRDLAVEGWRVEWTTPRTRAENIGVTRIGKAEILADPTGVELYGARVEAYYRLGLLTRTDMDTPGAEPYEQALAGYAMACRAAPAFAWITTPANTRADQLAAGRAWVRLQTAAIARGLQAHPLSQVLQEFPEMAPLRQAAHDSLTEAPGETVQMLARVGHGPAGAPSARHALEAVLRPAG